MPALLAAAVTLDHWRGSGQPTLTGDGLTLRPWVAADVDVVVHAYADPAIQRWHVQSMTAAEAAQWIAGWPARWQAATGADWAVTDGTGDVVGRIGFNHVDLFEGDAAIAYWVLPAARGHHVAPRALTALTGWALADGRFVRLALRHSTQNPASCRVAERAGFALEGTQRKGGRHADGDHDMHLHARVRGDA